MTSPPSSPRDRKAPARPSSPLPLDPGSPAPPPAAVPASPAASASSSFLFEERPAPDLPPLEEALAELVDPAAPLPDFAPLPTRPGSGPGSGSGSGGRSESRLGVAPDVAAGSQGITREIYATWADKGRRGKGIYKRFVEAMQRAADEFEVLAVARWNSQAEKDWRANAMLLEATRPDRFRLAPGRGAGGAVPAGAGLSAGTSGNPALVPAPIRIFLPPEAVVRPAGEAVSSSSAAVSSLSAPPAAPVSSSGRAAPRAPESGGGVDLSQTDDEDMSSDMSDEDDELQDDEAEAPAAE